jgi:SSS family solute:Na+ symporter
MWTWVKIDPTALRYVALSPDAKALAQDMYQALWSFLTCVIVTVVVSLATKPRPDSALAGLVYGETEIPSVGDVPLYQKPLFWAAIVGIIFIVLNIICRRRTYVNSWQIGLNLFFIGISLLINGADSGRRIV